MYKCCNYENCGQSFDTREARDQHEASCDVPPTPAPEPRQTDH